ncbi:MAG TPA: Gfo/Idh/MocA family oxidoreductase, partial [Chitinophagaceae bacterium]|nr:Gfo/Idh/MocA family oxidoreductase [Chitinophagaceae bacterium]
MSNNESNRRKFIRSLALSTAAVAAGTRALGNENKSAHFTIQQKSRFTANDNINIALIGSGGMGVQDTITALQVPGVKLIAVCDLYDGRLQEAKTRWGKDIITTRSYKEILSRKDIDAVIIATPDHWHQQISIDALKAGKHVYCEKPMVHSILEGPAVIKAQKESGKVFQVGSQGVSSLGNEKAKELLKSGAIGELNYA